MRMFLAATAAVAASALSLSVAGPASAASPSRSTAPGQACWSYTLSNTITKLRVKQVDYTSQFHWCAQDGRVTEFVVDKDYAIASGWTENAGIDIRPFRPGDFNRPSYDIFVNVWGDKKEFPVSVNYHGISVKVTQGEYRDFWDIRLGGDGTITGTRYKVR